jgi:hypothetical protein
MNAFFDQSFGLSHDLQILCGQGTKKPYPISNTIVPHFEHLTRNVDNPKQIIGIPQWPFSKAHRGTKDIHNGKVTKTISMTSMSLKPFR